MDPPNHSALCKQLVAAACLSVPAIRPLLVCGRLRIGARFISSARDYRHVGSRSTSSCDGDRSVDAYCRWSLSFRKPMPGSHLGKLAPELRHLALGIRDSQTWVIPPRREDGDLEPVARRVVAASRMLGPCAGFVGHFGAHSLRECTAPIILSLMK